MHVTRCRMCQSPNLATFLDLGRTPPADQFLFADQISAQEEAFPLEVVTCTACGLAQLSYIVPADVLYCNDYPYEASITASGRRHWKEFADTVSRMLDLGQHDLVVDFGSNVGVLLQMFQGLGMRVLGVDPAPNIAAIANSRGIETRADFFNSGVAADIAANHGQAKVICGTNVFAHVDDLHDLIQAVDVLLHPEGALVIEAPYLVDLIEGLEYDTIYHEHLSYLSLKPLVSFFASYDMEIFEVQRRDIHGGSFRFYVRRRRVGGRPVNSVIAQLLAAEEQAGIYNLARLDTFAKNVAHNREELRRLLSALKQSGSQIAGVSAPAKGMTLLNYCGIGSETVDFVTEKTTLKIGRFTPGGHIPVVSDDVLLEKRPDYALLLAWNFADEIMANLKAYSDLGSKFIIPIPSPKIVG